MFDIDVPTDYLKNQRNYHSRDYVIGGNNAKAWHRRKAKAWPRGAGHPHWEPPGLHHPPQHGAYGPQNTGKQIAICLGFGIRLKYLGGMVYYYSNKLLI